jgi:type II secretory pathway component GspD/PulD (secretin)
VDLHWDRILDGSAKQLISAGSLESVGVPAGLNDATLTGIGTLTLEASDLTIVIKALQTKGDARTISNPKVIVANGETARINILEKVPKVQRTLTTETDAAGISTKTVSVTQQDDGVDDDTKRKRFVEFEFGIRLSVTPTIYSEENIAVQVVPIISRVNTEKTIVSFVGEDGATPPNKIYDTYYAIDEKRVNTTFMLGNKRTAVIGGLTETKNIDRERKVPLLGSIPLIQHLFTHKYSEKVQTENIIFVTVSLEDGKSFDVAKAVKQSPLTRKQLVRDENNQVVDDRAVELFKEQGDSRTKDEIRVIERKEQAESHDRTLLAPARKILRP